MKLKNDIKPSTFTFAAFIGQQFVFDQLPQNLVASSMFETGNGRNKTHWDNFVILHAHFHLHTPKK